MLTLLFLAAAAAVLGQGDAEFKRVCYVSNWAQYRPGDGSFKPPAIDPTLCTHINYAFGVINTAFDIIPYEWNDDGPGGLYEQVNAHKATNPSLKTLIAIGGWNFGMDLIAQMLSNAANRQHFVDSAISFCRSRGFDGLDLDFEYPANRGSPPEDKANFVSLVQTLRAAFNAEGGGNPLLLTAAVAAGKATIDSGFDVPAISASLDFINLMTYDFNGAWDTVTGLNAPLYVRSDEIGTDRETLNVNFAANYWVSLGCPPEKLIIGMGTYGRCFTLANPANSGLGAAVTGPCTAGTYTREAGFLSYYEICDIINAGGATTVYDKETEGVYTVYNGNQWVGYDHQDSLAVKVQYALASGFGGLMVWNMDLDDFTGTHCNGGNYPLMTRMSLLATGGTVGPTTPTTPYTGPSTTRAPTTQYIPPGGSGFCAGKADGLYADPESCSSFYHCGNGNGVATPCTPGLYYNPITSNCDWSYNLSNDRLTECGLSL